jgi:serine protease Do
MTRDVKGKIAWLLLAGGVGAAMGLGVSVRLPVGTSALAQSMSEAPLWSEGSKNAQGIGPDAPVTMSSFVRLAKTLGPAVVFVSTKQDLNLDADDPRMDPFEWFFGQGNRPQPRRQARGLGTGFVIRKDGYILTNHHVVKGADEIQVKLADDRTFTGKVVGAEPDLDVALLKIEKAGDLPAAPLGDSDALEVGEWVIAIGNPLGLDHTVTAGIVSAKERRRISDGTGDDVPRFSNFIQTDASINPGNSGGPLINARGEVVGINTAIRRDGQGIGFAIPINMVKTVVPQLAKNGRVQKGWLGVQIQPVTAPLARSLGLPDAAGALIGNVVEGSPAERAGLRSGDVIVEFGGRTVRRSDDLPWIVSTTGVGKKVPLGFVRDGNRKQLEIVLGEAPQELQRASLVPGKGMARDPKRGALGITVAELNPQTARELGLKKTSGVVVLEVDNDAPATEAGIERGDVIVQVNAQPITSVEDYVRITSGVPRGAMLRLLVARRGAQLWVAFPKR